MNENNNFDRFMNKDRIRKCNLNFDTEEIPHISTNDNLIKITQRHLEEERYKILVKK